MTWELSVSVLFGVGIDVAHQYPGICYFCQHLEDTYHPQFLQFDGSIWGMLGRERQESVDDFWEWCFSVARAWRSLRTGNNRADNPTIQAVLCQFLSGPYSRSRMENLNEIPKAVISGAIVQTLCWLSAAVKLLMYVPTPHEAAAPQTPRPPDTPSTIEAQDTTGPFTTTGSVDGTIAAQVMGTPDPASATITQTTDESHWSGMQFLADEISQGHSTTPTTSGIVLEVDYGEKTVSVERGLEGELGGMFHALYEQAAHGRQNAEPVAWNAAKFAEDILHNVILKKYGAIELKWVDTINQHMHLDLRTRELSLFRFPSLCAVRANGATTARDVSMAAKYVTPIGPILRNC